jgi:hypothetical protein
VLWRYPERQLSTVNCREVADARQIWAEAVHPSVIGGLVPWPQRPSPNNASSDNTGASDCRSCPS